MYRMVFRSSAPVLCLLAAGLALPAVAPAQEEPAHDPLPPPLVAPVIVPPGEEPVLAPLAAPAITFEERVLEIVNQERAAVGLPPLKGVEELFDSSGAHSFNMADRDFFAHCDPDDMTQPWDRMFLFGYDWSAAAENVAGGFQTPEDVMAGWMASPGHRANILSMSFREVGVGYFEQPGDQNNVRLDQNGDCTPDGTTNALFRYWTQNFGRRNSVFPLVINRESHDTVCAELQLYVYGPANATQMRFSNDGVSWSPFEPYSPTKLWTLPGASGSPANLFSEVTNGSTTFSAQDEIILGSGFPTTSNLNVPQQTVSTTETFQACDTVSATSGFEVTASGDVTFHAGRRIVLGDGFSVASGGTFRAIVDSTL